MITVIINKDFISANGHADSAPFPYDLCCECFGLLCQTLTNSLEKIGLHPPQQIYKGHFYINKKEIISNEKARTLLDAFETGCELLQLGYPDNIKLVYPDSE